MVRRTVGVLVAWLAVPALVVALPGAGPVAAQTTLTVDSTGDGSDAAPGDGVCLAAGGGCSLRAAIEEANAQSGPNTIRFGLRGGDVHTINVGRTLTIADRSGGLTIDGYTQAGAAPNTSAGRSNAAIKINVTTSAEVAPMVLITSSANTIRGLAIYGNGPRVELRGEEADGNRLIGNFIGTDATGTATSSAPSDLRGIDAGVVLNLGPDRNVIGTPDLADRNVISANNGYGIRINHGETSQNIVENNIIGLSPALGRMTMQRIGIDVQWWTWGNYISNNLISGHVSQGIDLSHSTIGNTVVGNRIGTGSGGNGATTETSNKWGITFKDNPTNNYVADNVIGNSTHVGIWHKHNYTGANVVVRNRIGVGSRGGAIGNAAEGVQLRGHDDLYQDNIIANNGGGAFFISDTTPPPGQHTNYPAEATKRNKIRQNTFYRNVGPDIDIEELGQNPNNSADDDGAHEGLNHPEITGIGPGEVYGTACANCYVDIYVSGKVRSDGTINTGNNGRGTGAGWIGSTMANGRGRWSLAHPHIKTGKNLTTLAIDAAGNTSETSPSTSIPSAKQGNGSNAGQSQARIDSPATPDRPPAYTADTFTCSWDGGTLSWTDEGAAEYYVRTVAADGVETYVGPRSGTSTAVPAAAGYRVVNWSRGYARSATCAGPGDPVAPGAFSCSYAGGTLSWTDGGATAYYIRLVDGAGVDTYFGSSTGNALAAPPSASYMVIHWNGPNRTIAACEGGR